MENTACSATHPTPHISRLIWRTFRKAIPGDRSAAMLSKIPRSQEMPILTADSRCIETDRSDRMTISLVMAAGSGGRWTLEQSSDAGGVVNVAEEINKSRGRWGAMGRTVRDFETCAYWEQKT
jgi:hypothetical protein